MFRHWYRDNDGVITEVTAYVDAMENPINLTTHAEEGSSGSSTQVLNDPTGSLLIRPHRKYFVTSTVAEDPTNRTVWVGYIQDIDIERMDPWANGARKFTLQLRDLNTILDRRIMTGKDTSRPAESDVARVQWLEATNEGSLIDDNSYIFTDDPVDMDAQDDAYYGQQFINVLSDCANQSGKNYFLFNLDTGDSNTGDYNLYRLWYGDDFLEEFVSDIRLTNDEADLDDDTWIVFTNVRIERLGQRIHSGAYVTYPKGYVYVQREQTADAFARIDRMVSAENVKTAAKAKARAARELSQHDTYEEIIYCTVEVAEERVNALMAGQKTAIKLIHSDDQTDWTPARVVRRTVRERAGSGRVQIDYQLALPKPTTPSVANGGVLDEGHGPYQTSHGNDIIYYKADGDGPPPGWPLEPTSGLITALTDGSAPNANYTFYGWEMGGTGTVDATFRASAAGVKGSGTYDVTWAIRKNGVVVASEVTVVTGTGLAYWSDTNEVTVSALSVTSGDVLTVSVSCAPPMPGAIVVPAGTGGLTERFEITDGSLV